ncbi:MAG: hypothetical protein HKO59_04120, partial [Phycisphaerales bacterium]|nr:hypothetical protein [Phycisphaerales bacterium]
VTCPSQRPTLTKGSLVISPRVELRWDAAGFLVRDTFLSLTNDHPSDVRILAYFVNGDSPLPADPTSGERAHPGWNWLDNELTLTGNQPVYWSALSGQPAAGGVSPFTALDPGAPPGRPAGDGSGDRVLRGFVYAWAVNAKGEEIRWNHLAAEATIVDYRGGASWSCPAVSHGVVSGVPHGDPPDPTPGVLNLDGVEYDAGFATLRVPFQAVGSAAFSGPRLITSDTELTLLPLDLDVRQETSGVATTLMRFDVWNMNEVKLSGARRCVSCWDQVSLGVYDPPNHFLLETLQTDHGVMRIDGTAAADCIDSTPRAAWAIATRRLRIDGGADDAASTGVAAGAGFEAAVVRFDPVGGPPR